MDKVREQLSRFLRLELSMEIVFQVTATILLLLLSETDTPTTEGLRTFFQQATVFGLSSRNVLILTILLNLKSCIGILPKATAIEKEFLPFGAKLLLYLYSIFGPVKRVFVLVCYFLPFLGNVGLLAAWKYEKKQWGIRTRYSKADRLQVFGATEEVEWDMIDRWRETMEGLRVEPPYTLYTLISLQSAFVTFLGLLSLHIIVLYVVKKLTTRQGQSGNWMSLLTHSLENLVCFTPWR